MAVTAGDLTAGRLWAIRGLAGAGVGLVLAGALAAVLANTDTALGDRIGWLVWLVLLPLSPLLGYDLATGGGREPGPLLRAGGYSVAVAAAQLVVALGVAACVGWGVDARSPIWMVPLGLGLLVVAPARRWALLGGAALMLLMALILQMVAAGFWLNRVDS